MNQGKDYGAPQHQLSRWHGEPVVLELWGVPATLTAYCSGSFDLTLMSANLHSEHPLSLHKSQSMACDEHHKRCFCYLLEEVCVLCQ